MSSYSSSERLELPNDLNRAHRQISSLLVNTSRKCTFGIEDVTQSYNNEKEGEPADLKQISKEENRVFAKSKLPNIETTAPSYEICSPDGTELRPRTPENITSCNKLLTQQPDGSSEKAPAFDIVEPVITKKYKDEKAKRLAEYVEKLDDIRSHTGAAGLKLERKEKMKKTIDQLLAETEKIEQQIFMGENEVFYKTEMSFYGKENETEIMQLINRQAEQLKNTKLLHEELLEDRKERKKNKNFQIKINRERKVKDKVIRNQEAAHKVAIEIKEVLRENQEKTERLILITKERHLGQRKNLAMMQDRKMTDQKLLMEIKCQDLSREELSEAMKEFQFRMNHQKNLDKKATDHLNDTQVTELRQIKEKSRVETKMMEDIPSLQATQLAEVQKLEFTQKNDYYKIKDIIANYKETIHILKTKISNEFEIGKVKRGFINQMKQWRAIQSANTDKLKAKWSTFLCRDLSNSFNGFSSPTLSPLMSGMHTAASCPSTESDTMRYSDIPESPTCTMTSEEDHDVDVPLSLESQLKAAMEGLQRNEQLLSQLKEKQKDVVSSLKKKHRDELTELEEKFQKSLLEIQWKHEIETKDLKKTREAQINESLMIQEHELEMESFVRKAETRALQERKVLGSLLDTVVDGVISIDPLGVIKRFNSAAENMFGYSASEIISKNIKELMPTSYAKQHDGFLYNYLKTGEKKVIGKGRDVFGIRKDGTIFPMALSVSEVIEDGFHIFTGIVRDLTEDVIKQKKMRKEEEQQKRELKALCDELASARAKSLNLLGQLLPTEIANQILRNEPVAPKSYDICSIFFSDVVGFTSIASKSQGLDVVNLLNDLYTIFDSVIDKKDVYKVETIGDAYMVVSGVPRPTADHACEIADMALEILSKMYDEFKVRHMPDFRLTIRIGIHSGPCLAGVVGSKMPRYCLFGDSVSIAEIMESSGSPMRIQISETTFNLLQAAGGYIMDSREELVEVHGVNMRTYWLSGKESLSLPLPKLKEWPVISHIKG